MAEREDRVRAFFDRPQRYLAGNLAIPVRARLVAELVGDVRGDRVIDLGCGNGAVSRQFIGQALALTLVDRSPKMLGMAREAIPNGPVGEITYINADLIELPDDQHDVVICVGVLAHVASVEESVAKVARLTKPGGRCVIQLTDQEHPVGRLLHLYHDLRLGRGPHGYTVNRLSVKSMVRTAADVGLVAVADRRYSFMPRGLSALSPTWLLRLERWMLDPRRRALGSEVMVLLVKPEGSSPR